MFGNKQGLERELGEQGGTVAWATVVEAVTRWTSGSNYENGPYTVGNNSHMKVKLTVAPDGQPPFEATFHQTFPGRTPIEGFQVKVIYDPQDHSRIAILEDQIFPPGITHEQAEHTAARRQQMEAAAKSGHMAEFVQEDIRARQAEAMAHVQQAQAASMGGAGAGKPDVADELTKLADLRDRGVLTDAEFEAQKAKVLAGG